MITSPNAVAVADDTAGVFYTATASDADGDVLQFSIVGGDDRSAFAITAMGSLSFIEPANFEVPTDQNRDNVYNVQIQVSDGKASHQMLVTAKVEDTPTPTENAAAWRLVANAPWQARDSAGYTVFGDRLWLLGGWLSSYEPAPRDVWYSNDGTTWTQATPQAPWTHGDFVLSVAFKGWLWAMGGYDKGRLPDATASNEVWSSADGTSWTMESKAGWSPRIGAALVVFKDRMWLLGGVERYYDGTEQSLRNDVWYTENGRDWVRATASAAWPARAYHSALAFNDRIYVFGGGNYVPGFQQRNDVWSSSDGVNWRRETAQAEWMPRIWASAAVFSGRMWLLGGHGRTNIGDPSTGFNLNDVWTSTDGARWTKMISPSIWSPQHAMSVWVKNGELYVAGGFDGSQLSNQVWALK